jgi:ribonuclease HII
MNRKKMNDTERFACLSQFERQAAAEGFHAVAGIDEAGRGPLAGPVAAAAVILDPQTPILGLNDSKKLSAARRELLAAAIREKSLAYAIVMVDAAEIDRINILQATKQAMRQAVRELTIRPDLLLVDAVALDQVEATVWPIIRGDAQSNSIAAASILAKVSRDRHMSEMDQLYPGYGFARHKGYGTAEHFAAIRNLGPSPIHRQTFLKNL